MVGWSVRDKLLPLQKPMLDCGRPKKGAVVGYHYSIRKVKRDEDTLFNEGIADSITNPDARDFW